MLVKRKPTADTYEISSNQNLRNSRIRRYCNVRFEVLTAVLLKIKSSWM